MIVAFCLGSVAAALVIFVLGHHYGAKSQRALFDDIKAGIAPDLTALKAELHAVIEKHTGKAEGVAPATGPAPAP